MATIKKYNGSTWENAVVRKYGTASEIITLPTIIYADGTAITAYTLKGNEEHTGTPSPSNPVMPNGVGNKTANLFDYATMRNGVTGAYLNSDGSQSPQASWNITTYIPCNGTTFTIRLKGEGYNTSICLYDDNKAFLTGQKYNGVGTVTITSSTTAKYIRFSIGASWTEDGLMLNEGSTAKPYEPYGYKIPILTAQGTTNIYLGSVQSERKICKLVLTGDETLSYQVQPPLFIINIPTNHFIPRVTALCTEYNYNPAQSSILANSQHGDFGLQYVNVRDEYNVWFNNSTYATNDDFKTYLAQQYANGTPVTVWYVLATPETATVNEPLMKIGDYADTLSNATAIPTTEGANSITVDTTVQPSEFTATWTGWHDSSVQEYDGSDWN